VVDVSVFVRLAGTASVHSFGSGAVTAVTVWRVVLLVGSETVVPFCLLGMQTHLL
jgi:hypothetical protein